MTAFTFEATGNTKLPSQEELLKVDEDTAVLAYSQGTMDGNPYWAYVAVRPSKYREFHRRSTAHETIVLKNYGTVLAGGFAASPPAEVVREMQEKYGADPGYEKKLADKREETRIMDIVTMLKKKQVN